MRILAICQHYWPEHFQITETCEELVRRGHDVTALVGIPNYPDGVVPAEYQNGMNRIQEHNGVKIIRVEEVPRRPGVMGLARNYFSYMSKSKVRAKKFKQGEFDVIFSYEISPVFMSAAIADAHHATGAPSLLYCADIWPDAVKAMLPEKLNFTMPLITKMSTDIYRSADFIATNAPSYNECLRTVHGIDPARMKCVPQYAEDSYLGMDLEPEPHEKARLMVMGNIGKLQDMPSLFKAVARIKGRDDFELHVVGTGSVIEWCKQFVRDEQMEGIVTFHGRHPYAEMPDFYRLADACLLTLNVPGAPWISSTLPSRLQGYMAAGKPVLAAISGSAADVIAESGCGKAAPAGDDEAYARVISDFLDNRDAYAECGEAGRTYYRDHFTKNRYMDEIEGLLLQLADAKKC